MIHDCREADGSQQNWLDVSQEMNPFTAKMDEMACAGRNSRHLHYGFSGAEVDPLSEVLGKNYLVSR